MKKKLLCLLLAASVTQTISAQDRESSVQKGDNLVNLYYGPNLAKAYYKGIAKAAGVDDAVKINSIGPLGLVYEHMMTNVVGLGVDVGYSAVSMGARLADQNPNGELEYYDAQWKISTLRAMVRVNFHFIHNSPNFDMYALVSAGYRHLGAEFTYNSPYSNNSYKLPNLIPFGIKPGLGMRYFFTKAIGVNFELAAGTPVICGGLSLRF